MAYPRPKILTGITVPTAGWTLRFKVSDAASLDTTCDITIPAGTYYIAWDGQSDDLLAKIATLMKTEIDAEAAARGANMFPYLRLNSDNKVEFYFDGSSFVDSAGWENDVSIIWTSGTSADLAAALGFDATADDSSTGTDYPSFTADYQHGYGWYAEEDGQLESLLVEDHQRTETMQAIAYGGQVKSQQMGSRFINELRLNFLSRALTFSRGVSYGSAPVNPYTRNKPLECWWREAQQGTRFRVYREGRNDGTVPIERGVATASDTTSVTDSSKAFTTAPQEHAGRILHLFSRHSNVASDVGRAYISSHTATVFTLPTCPDGQAWEDIDASNDTYAVLDMRYQTYVLDIDSMSEFAPNELPERDEYGITIPLLRYEA